MVHDCAARGLTVTRLAVARGEPNAMDGLFRHPAILDDSKNADGAKPAAIDASRLGKARTEELGMRNWLMSMAVLAALLYAATSVAAPPAARSLAVYGNGIALVQEQRTVDVPRGRAQISLSGVSPRLVEGSVQIQAAGLAVREQQLRYDLASRARLLQRYIGRRLELVRVNPHSGEEETIQGTLLAVSGDVAMYRIGQSLEIADGNFPWRPRLPLDSELSLTPALLLTVDSASAGQRRVDLRYLTEGMNWRAEYIALLRPQEGLIDLTAMAVVENATDMAFDGDLDLVAGTVYRSAEPPRPYTRTEAMMAAAPDAVPSGDLYRFSFSEPVTLPAQSRQQLRLLSRRDIPVHREYRLRGIGSQPQPREVTQQAESWLRLENKSPALGEPLPAGVVRVYQAEADGRSLWVGEAAMNGLAVGQYWEAALGQAFDVSVERRQLAFRNAGDRARELEWQLRVSNAGKQEANVVVEEIFYGDWRVVEENVPHKRVDAQRAHWLLQVPAGGSVELRYQVLVH